MILVWATCATRATSAGAAGATGAVFLDLVLFLVVVLFFGLGLGLVSFLGEYEKMESARPNYTNKRAVWWGHVFALVLKKSLSTLV